MPRLIIDSSFDHYPRHFLITDDRYPVEHDPFDPGPPTFFATDFWLKIVYHILLFHQGPIETFHISHHFENCSSDVDQFFLFATKNGIQDLGICNEGGYASPQIPLYLYPSDSLKSLELGTSLLQFPNGFRGCRSLTNLDLYHIHVSDQDIARLISGCENLEELNVDSCTHLQRLVIHAPKLRRLHLGICDPMRVFVNYAPCLVDCSIGVFPLNLQNSMEEGCKLFWLLENLLTVRNLNLYEIAMECLSKRTAPMEFPPAFLNLRQLYVNVNFADVRMLDVLTCFLRSSPHLRDFDISVKAIQPKEIHTTTGLLGKKRTISLSLSPCKSSLHRFYRH